MAGEIAVYAEQTDIQRDIAKMVRQLVDEQIGHAVGRQEQRTRLKKVR